MRKRSRRWMKAALLAAATVICAPTAITLYIRSAAPAVEGSIATAGLAGDVEVLRDSLGVPYIRATTEMDLYFTQGWVHAQDRLWQMEFFRRVGQGRLSEILGAGLVETDRFMRTIGVLRAARREEASLDPSTKEPLVAYAAGVNAWIGAREGALPPEFLVLRSEPEPWTPLHSLVIAKVMALDLSLYSTAEQATRSAARLGEDRARLLVPGYPPWGSMIVDPPVPAPVPVAAARAVEAISITNASNAWAVGGARTRSGSPILANDMHLALRAPSLWYLSALHAPGIDVAGMTLPGIPFVIAGHNRAIAWGYSNAMVDDADLFAERVDPGDAARYVTPWGSEPFEVVRDTIRVRGGASEPFEVRLTRHGPVIDAIQPEERGMVLSLRWAAHDPSRSIDGIRALNRASNWSSFLEAVDLFEDPHQNVVYADTAGNIGYVMGGRVPIRGDGRRPPTLPVPGWTGEWDWSGWLPFERHPRVFNPPQGFVVTANNRQAAGGDADLISTFYETPFRADRIRHMIEESRLVDAMAVHVMQLDVHDALAVRYRGLAAKAARRAGRDEAARVLEAWDLRADSESAGAAVFYAWYEELRSRVASALYGGAPGWLPRGAFDAVLDSAALFWSDDPAGSVFDSLAAAAAAAADSVAGGRSWGELHSVRAGHPLSASSLMDAVFGLDVGGVPAAGSPTTVNVSQYGGGGFPVEAHYGPSQRHVVDMGDIDGAGGFIVPTGQSGLPFHRHYRDQWPLWQRGGLWSIPLDSTVARARAAHRLTLMNRQ